jgi:Mrp family chromosome partitioning ATPase
MSSAEAIIRIVKTNLEFMLSTCLRAGLNYISDFHYSRRVKLSYLQPCCNLQLKVLLIGMDIRNPKLGAYLDIPERGLTNYLASKDLKIQDLIVKYEGYEDLHCCFQEYSINPRN